MSDKGNSAVFYVLAIAPDSKSFITGDHNGILNLWNLDRKSETRTIPSPGGLDSIVNLTFSPDGKTLVAVHLAEKRWDAGSVGISNTTDWTAHTLSGYSAAAFSQEGRLMALGGPDINPVDVASGKELRSIDLPTPTIIRVKPHLILPAVPTRTKNFLSVSALLRSRRTGITSPSAPSKERCA